MLRHHIGLTTQQIEQVNQRLGQEDAILHRINTWKERAKQAKTCSLVRCLVYTNLFICLLITFLDSMMEELPIETWSLLLIVIVLQTIVYLLALFYGTWNEERERMELNPRMTVWIILLMLSCSMAFYQSLSLHDWKIAFFSVPLGTMIMTLILLWITYLIKRKTGNNFPASHAENAKQNASYCCEKRLLLPHNIKPCSTQHSLLHVISRIGHVLAVCILIGGVFMVGYMTIVSATPWLTLSKFLLDSATIAMTIRVLTMPQGILTDIISYFCIINMSKQIL